MTGAVHLSVALPLLAGGGVEPEEPPLLGGGVEPEEPPLLGGDFEPEEPPLLGGDFEPEEPPLLDGGVEPEEPPLLGGGVEPEEPPLLGGGVEPEVLLPDGSGAGSLDEPEVDPELAVALDGLLVVLAVGELEPDPLPQPARTSVATARPQSVFNGPKHISSQSGPLERFTCAAATATTRQRQRTLGSKCHARGS